MSKHINQAVLYPLPSGALVHPCRLIQRDGTLMWKHALLYRNELNLPTTSAQEAHIQKTAQRLEELNSWVSQDLEPLTCLNVTAWYCPTITELSEGIGVYFNHNQIDNFKLHSLMKPHIQEHEVLSINEQNLYFKRC